MSSRKNRFSKKSFRPFLGFLLFVYFVLHLVQGDRGYMNLKKLERDKRDIQLEYNALKEKREALEHRVVMLRGPKIDPDLLDEQVRDALGFVDAKDTLLKHPRAYLSQN